MAYTYSFCCSPSISLSQRRSLIFQSKFPQQLRITQISFQESVFEERTNHTLLPDPISDNNNIKKNCIWVNPRNPKAANFKQKSFDSRRVCSSEVISHLVLQTDVSSSSSSHVGITHKHTFGRSQKQHQSLLLKKPLNKDFQALVTQDTSAPFLNDGKIGVLLLNLGGPETLDDVQPFLFNLFADPDIIRLPRLFRFLQKPLAQFISVARAPKSKEGYASIGGGSPLRQITDAQATELRKALYEKNVPADVYVGMRYWHPFTEEAIEQIKKDGVNKLVVLPLYPQFSISTSGSSLRLLESIFREDEYLVNMQHTVIPSWYQREGYIKAMADLIEKELIKFDCPEKVMIFFSAHGVPLAYVEEAGDPYKAEMEECVDLIMEELERRKINNPYTLAYQSRVGPVEWLKPYTDTTIIELGEKGVKSLLAVPISFVSEHIETLEEIDVEYKELALKSGIEKWGRVPALGCNPTFILDLADAVIESLPYVGAMAVSNIEARQSLVPLGSVEELLATYDSQRRELPAPVTVWEWGFTKSAETWNGRAAMLAVIVLLFLEVSTGEGFLHQWGVLPLQLPLFP